MVVDPEESEVVIVITSWQMVYIVRSVMDSNNYEVVIAACYYSG